MLDPFKFSPKYRLGTDPAAGDEISETVPDGKIWLLFSIKANLVTDATVANRIVYWVIKESGGNIVIQSGDATNHTASNNIPHSFTSIPKQGDLGGVYNSMAPAIPMIMPEGWQVETSTVNLQAGDNWAAPLLWLQEVDAE